ncbi:TVP38/TMEM64 family protein [Caenispirillum bisanense]|uniref:TVP38/TMEM64 family protein n=1 Tax=Caenispirillum bisanense TaxID=414052 RepID=UPI0031D01BA8
MQRRFLILFLALFAAACAGFLVRYGGWAREMLVSAQRGIEYWVDLNPVLGAAAFLVVASLGKITPFPGGIILMLAGGYLFGSILGPILAAVGAALGAVAVGYFGRMLLFDTLDRRFGHRISHLERAVVEDGFNWILAARLLPVLPAWLVNLVPVVFPIHLGKVFAATALGLLPISFVLGGIGSSLSNLAAAEMVPSEILMSADVIVPLVGLAAVALAPVLIKALRRHRRRRRHRRGHGSHPPAPPSSPAGGDGEGEGRS